MFLRFVGLLCAWAFIALIAQVFLADATRWLSLLDQNAILGGLVGALSGLSATLANAYSNLTSKREVGLTSKLRIIIVGRAAQFFAWFLFLILAGFVAAVSGKVTAVGILNPNSSLAGSLLFASLVMAFVMVLFAVIDQRELQNLEDECRRRSEDAERQARVNRNRLEMQHGR